MAIEEFWGFESVELPLAQQMEILREDARWKSRRVIGTKLSNGDTVWFKKVYEHRMADHVFEVICEEEYMMRKLAGKLKYKYDPAKWEKPSRGTYMVGP